MGDLNKLVASAKSTWHMLGMMILTFGIYQFLWMMKNRLTFNTFSKNEVTEWNVYLIAAVFAWIGILQQSAPTPAEDLAVATIVGLIILCLQVTLPILIYLFVTSKVILGLSETIRDGDNNSDIKFNRFFAFLFQCFYINFKLNQIAMQRDDRGAARSTESSVVPDSEKRFLISTGSSSDDSREVSQSELYSLYRSGSIPTETLIWTEGWSEWRTCGSLFGKEP